MANQTFVNNMGTTYVQRDVVSSTITTSDVNIFETIGNGVLIESVTVTTDATGLAGSTALVLKANGVTFFQTAVSGLGANAVKDIKNASVTGSTVTVPAGTKYVTVAGTVAVGTGAGKASITLGVKKLDSNSSVNPL
jgi:hypothetical protein